MLKFLCFSQGSYVNPRSLEAVIPATGVGAQSCTSPRGIRLNRTYLSLVRWYGQNVHCCQRPNALRCTEKKQHEMARLTHVTCCDMNEARGASTQASRISQRARSQVQLPTAMSNARTTGSFSVYDSPGSHSCGITRWSPIQQFLQQPRRISEV